MASLAKAKFTACTDHSVDFASSSPWPQVATDEVKVDTLRKFRHATSSTMLASFYCPVCAGRYLVGCRMLRDTSDIDLSLLRRPDCRLDGTSVVDPNWYTGSAAVLNFGIEDEFEDVLVDFASVYYEEDGSFVMQLCTECDHYLMEKHQTPPLVLANHVAVGNILPELRDLTPVEEAMVSKCRAKAWIVQLRELPNGDGCPNSQHGLKGHVMIFPQEPDHLLSLLPPSLTEVSMPICILFVGSCTPSPAWLHDHAKPLIVRCERVRNALLWLKANNPLYLDVNVNLGILNALADEQLLPVHVEVVSETRSAELLSSRYDCSNDARQTLSSELSQPNRKVAFDSVAVSDLDQNSSLKDQKIAALCHL